MSDLQTAFSTESGRTYTLDKLIGKGGFGEVYLATPTPRDGLPEQVCVKITERLSSWLREARSEAIAAAKKAGAIFQAKPGAQSDVLVRGRPNALQIAGQDGGAKLLEIRRLAAEGHVVKVIGERQFWKLVESSKPSRRAKPKPKGNRRTAVRRD